MLDADSIKMTQVELEVSKDEGENVGENQLYAEIGDPDTPTATVSPTQDVNAPTSPPPAAATGPSTSHQYDDVVLNVPKPGGDYQLTLCAAYGIQ